jgi:cell fate (sporulation/competence/biofilm development) regulator YlbF (YheA/YmcA/DUF963 family)
LADEDVVMRDELNVLLWKIYNSISTIVNHEVLTPDEQKSALKNEIKSLDDAKDALVWLMRYARFPLYLSPNCELISELFTLYPVLVNAKLSIAERIQLIGNNETLPEVLLDMRLPHTDGKYAVNENFVDSKLTECRYRNYALCTPHQFATIYDLKPLIALLEANPKFDKTIKAQEDEYPLNSINPFNRQSSLASKVRECLGPDDSAAYCNHECSNLEAQEVLYELMLKAKKDPREDENYAKIIKRLIEKHPQMNLNYLYNCGSFYSFIGNTRAIADVLLSQSTFDLTVPPLSSNELGYIKNKIIRGAAIKQFYREALAASPNEKGRLLNKFWNYQLKPKELREYIQKEIFSEIKSAVDAVPESQLKVEIFDAKKSDFFKPSVLMEFLGTEQSVIAQLFDNHFIDLIKANAISATSPAGAAVRYQQAMDELKKDNKPEKSRSLLHDILHDLVDDPSLDLLSTQAISELIKLCPDLDLNNTDFRYDESSSLSLGAWESKNKGHPGKKRLPAVAIYRDYGSVFARMPDEFTFSPLNPLMVASLLDCQNLVKFLLKQPKIDLTKSTEEQMTGISDEIFNRQVIAYDLASTHCRSLLEEALYGELQRKLLDLDAKSTEEITYQEKYEWYKSIKERIGEAGLTPAGLSSFLSRQIKAQMEAQQGDEKKLNVLQEAYRQLQKNDSALVWYLDKEGDLRNLRNSITGLMEEIVKNQKKPAPPTSAPTVSSRSINDDNSKPDDAGPSTGFVARWKTLFK